MAATPSHRVSTGERINTAETTGKLQQILAGRGLRMTKQRRVILQVMDDAEQHLDVDQILARAQKIDSGVHLVTVYRTIDLLKKQGLIDELDLLHLRGDRHYYESHGPRDHIHVACLRCGKVREFESRLYEQLKEQIARDFNMKVTISRTEVGGYCAECLAAKPSLGEPAVTAKNASHASGRSSASHPPHCAREIISRSH
jgi:Fur family ferric uptake transcriptional regulator